MTHEAKTASNPQPQQAESSTHQRLISLAPPPLLDGEDRVAYDALLKKLADAVKPADVIEEIFVRDVIDLVWEGLRLRRLKVALMNLRSQHPLKSTLAVYNYVERPERECLDGDELMAATLHENIDFIDRVERLTALAEARRIAAFREIDRHRATLANELRHCVQQVEDAEFKVIEQQPQPTPAEDTEAAA
jgi:hypothetical protein